MQRLALAIAALLLLTGPAFAHAAGRGFVMLLPTGWVIAGGAAAVLVSFIAVTLLPRLAMKAASLPEPLSPAVAQVTSLVSALILAALLVLGFLGPRDPVENLLPLAIWTLWWVEIVMLHPLFGNLWQALNPFTGPAALLRGRLGHEDHAPPLRYPAWASYWPAVLIFFAFAWFQLVWPAPEDPAILATAVCVYLAVGFAAVLAFGVKDWLGKADPFAVFLAQLGAAAPFGRGGLRWPGAGLLALPALPVSGVIFVLLTLGTITFDGFANTFAWLSLIGINPLDYPGRTPLMAANTIGILLVSGVLAAGFFAAVWAGWRWAGRPDSLTRLCGRLVYSLIPISIAYHFAHYLGDTLVKSQYLLLALNDPLQRGADVFGIGHAHVMTSFQNTASGALAIYATQTLALVIGHVIGVAVAHAMAVEEGLPPQRMMKLELPLALCMVAYTGFGLWLLGAPAIA
ncbi:hypothetical protein DK847_06040 [Aestuariivirga litoralis]|uniref:Fenitrothion hydrolase n=1 Tax=Aestuariivirga litoralis TaxID=2650924 RepID=A0A2W2BCN2_9HYPH|nr:hypothetical protein [Aestuariivirga litoralis]PZF77984.1 hypothetical protein DK847_06040 [Aestuariivirga litoralis]